MGKRSASRSDGGDTIQPAHRFYTLAEANLKVPDLEKRFAEVARRMGLAQELNDQVNDLEIVWGAKLLDDACPEHGAYLEYKGKLTAEESAVGEILSAVRADGIDVKDVHTGLIDFYARRGAEVVYLCGRRGEREVGFWHTLQGGFAGRKPVKEF